MTTEELFRVNQSQILVLYLETMKDVLQLVPKSAQEETLWMHPNHEKPKLHWNRVTGLNCVLETTMVIEEFLCENQS